MKSQTWIQMANYWRRTIIDDSDLLDFPLKLLFLLIKTMTGKNRAQFSSVITMIINLSSRSIHSIRLLVWDLVGKDGTQLLKLSLDGGNSTVWPRSRGLSRRTTTKWRLAYGFRLPIGNSIHCSSFPPRKPGKKKKKKKVHGWWH